MFTSPSLPLLALLELRICCWQGSRTPILGVANLEFFTQLLSFDNVVPIKAVTISLPHPLQWPLETINLLWMVATPLKYQLCISTGLLSFCGTAYYDTRPYETVDSW
ncbi:hypothetical protein B0H10DRAFT_1955019 [Mycena sp. CBHHK59/15]|nr:hypothetical protein B0H10DRAFT_1955019 [Mycena sp. CBHHK59/15]